jgi:CRISPR-associated protein Csb1
MNMNRNRIDSLYSALQGAPRLLLEVELKPLQGHRFQPTGFPDLGPARYTAPDGTPMLLVESPQSVANRMELACWDAAAEDLIAELRGLPYIKILDRDGKHLSNSLLEAHRINSEYIMQNASRRESEKSFREEFSAEIGYQKEGRVDWVRFERGLLRYDPNSLLHGCFLEEIGGRLRIPRVLSGFIEAAGVGVAESGGVKNNIVQPELTGGAGNVPYSRTEFTAQRIVAYFNLDLAQLRCFSIPESAKQLLLALALFKIRRFLATGLRLRTACDLEPVEEPRVTRPADGVSLPTEGELLQECRRLIDLIRSEDATRSGPEKLFVDPPVTELIWAKEERVRR